MDTMINHSAPRVESYHSGIHLSISPLLDTDTHSLIFDYQRHSRCFWHSVSARLSCGHEH